MSLPAYPAYKDSGIEWLGEVPEHWAHKKLGFLGDAIIGLTYSPEDIVDENGILVLRSSNVQNGKISFKDNVFVNKPVPSKLIVKSGDILICSRNGSRDLIGKNALIDAESEGFTFGAFMTVFRSEFNLFLFYVLNSHIFDSQAGSFMTSTVNQLTTGNLNSFIVPLPPIEEQTKIAAFLDYETAKIDSLIAEQERLIALLKENFISLALSAFDESGVQFLRLENACVQVARPVVQEDEVLYTPIGLFNRGRGLFHKEPRVKDDMGDSDFFWIESGDLIFSGQFAWEGAVALSSDDDAGCVVSHRYPVIKGLDDITLTEYLFALFLTKHGDFLLNESSRGAAGRNRPLNMNLLLKEKIPVPSMELQLKIKAAIHKAKEIESEVNSQIELMKERRSALISAAVTGKIDVRHWQVPT